MLATLRNGHWNEDFRRIGNGLFIAGIATPTLSDHGSLLSGTIVVMMSIVLMVIAKLKEA